MVFGRQRRPPGDGDAADTFAPDALAHLDSLYGTALRLTRRPDAAEDLVQDTFLKALRARTRFAPGTNLKAWLFTILHNTWRNRLRDGARARVQFDSETADTVTEAGGWATAAAETPEALLLRETLDEDLQLALDELPEAFREAVWLRDVEELTYQEIAEVLDVPIGTVMSRISRGRRQLADLLTMARREQPAQRLPERGV